MESNQKGFDFLAVSIDKAVKAGHLPNPNKYIAEIEDRNKISTPSYIRALRARLIDLGYLGESPENRSNNFLDDRLKKAIKKYQSETGLDTDSWAGKETWKSLQKLVSFEDNQNPEEWGTLLDNLYSPAILRSVYLRLYVLGFINWEKRLNTVTVVLLEKNQTFLEAFDRFLDVAFILGITSRKLSPEININTLKALFQQDEIVSALARDDNRSFLKEDINQDFINSTARIELWLLGYNVSVGNPNQIMSKKKTGNKKEKLIGLADAIEDFWSQQEEENPDEKITKSSYPTYEFFYQVNRILTTEYHDDNRVEEDIIQRVKKLKKKDLGKLKSRLAEIGSSIWDGVKRVYRWIKRFVSKIIRITENVIKNLARLIANGSREIFRTVIKTIDIVYKGVKYLLNNTLPESDINQIVIYHDNDFDIKAFINDQAEIEKVMDIVNENTIQSLYFGSACHIMGFLVDISSQILKTFSFPIGGWFLALLSLARFGKAVKAISDEVELIDHYTIYIDDSPFANDFV